MSHRHLPHEHHLHHHESTHHHHLHHNSPIDSRHSRYRRHSTGSLLVENHFHPRHSRSRRISISLNDVMSTSRAPYHHAALASVRSVGSPISQLHHHPHHGHEEHNLEHHHLHSDEPLHEHHEEHHEEHHHEDHPHHNASKKSIKTEAPFNIHHPDPELVAQSMEADKVDDGGPKGDNGMSFEGILCCCFCTIALVTVLVTFVLVFFGSRP